ncbi:MULTISPECIES: hypothetical protein [Shewanella]|uniref:hypothetical protein n=1 Tax=Shewanella TaxID=22 RepID=UPI000B34262D|nr:MULTISPECIES: hypothetical protein [Shewanella]QXN27402.1 hypothetical protein KVP08_023195 [Shewanella putrefaciens]
MVVDYDELIRSLEAVERIAKSIEDQFFDLSSIGPSGFFVLLKKNGIALSDFLRYHTDLSDLLTLDICHDIHLVIRVRNSIMFIDHCILEVIQCQAETLEVG